MKIKKPHNVILSKKYPDKYFDWNTLEEFLNTEINEHPKWIKNKYDSDGNIIYSEDSDGAWSKRKYDQWGNEIYYENSYGYWEKSIYDEDGKEIYYENSRGFWIIED